MKRPEIEERANMLTHAFGTALSLVGAAIMIPPVLRRDDSLLTTAIVVYLFAMTGVYLSSTLSHFYTDERRLRRYRALDQAFIYLAIVASYTPFSIVYLNSTWWWFLLSLMWMVAIAGFLSKTILVHRINGVAIWLYLLLGWLPALGGMPWAKDMPFACVAWIIAGGVAYSVGTIFLFNDHRAWYFHSIWHLFVIAGSVIHFVGIYQCVVVS